MKSEELIILPHAFRHGLSEDEIRYAWENAIFKIERTNDVRENVIVAIGPTNELSAGTQDLSYCAGVIGEQKHENIVVIFHAKRPPIASLIREIEEWKWRNS